MHTVGMITLRRIDDKKTAGAQCVIFPDSIDTKLQNNEKSYKLTVMNRP